MALLTPEKEAERITNAMKSVRSLRERFETDLGLFRNEPFRMTGAAGEWDSFTCNDATLLANKVVDVLSKAFLKLTIQIIDEGKNEKKSLSKTERFVYGALNIADDLLTAKMEPPLKSSLAWYATVRGWNIPFAYIHPDEEDSDKIVCDVRAYDPFNTLWILGKNGLIWFCPIRYVSKDELNDEYPDNKLALTGDARSAILPIWDKSEYGVLVSRAETLTETGFTGEWVKPPEKHKLDHIPALVIPGRSTPPIQSDMYTDTIKNRGESCYLNNRNLYPQKNLIMSYYETSAGKAAKSPKIATYDSTKGGNPIDLPHDPDIKGNVVHVDVGKGQSITEMYKSQLPGDVQFITAEINGELSRGGIAPIAYGEINQQIPAAGIGLLQESSRSNYDAPKKTMERSYEWIAQEVISQYKYGDFGEMKLQGVDSNSHKFQMKATPKDVDDEWKMDAELVIDSSITELENVGKAIELKRSELMSDERIMDRILHIEDPDLEKDKLLMQKIKAIAGLDLRAAMKLFMDAGDYEAVKFISEELARRQMETQPQQQGGGMQGGGGQPGMMPSPQARVGGMQQAPMNRVPNAGSIEENIRLGLMGMTRGR